MNSTSSDSRPYVLVVDDETGLRDVLAFGLPKRGFDVACAPDGETAVRLAKEKPFDLVVCDIMMPGMDGLSVLETIKKFSPTTEVIMATGFATLETAVESMKKGAYDYVTKPYTVNNLCAIMEKALEHRRLSAKVAQLEEVNRLKSEFIAVMSHELRTPIACTMGFISLLLEGIYGELNPRQRDSIERVARSNEVLLKLVGNILDLSQISANRMRLSEEVFDLRELAQEVIRTLEALANKKGLTLVLDAPQAITVLADHTKLKEILLNLLGNSVKFTEKGRVALGVHAGSGKEDVAIKVSDTGIGIREQDVPKLFTEFTQLDSSTTRRYGGTGLGLCITKKMVELMKGDIRVESQLGAGTTFYVNLPIQANGRTQKEAIPVPIPDDVESKSGKKIILSVDDDPMVLKLLADSLEGTDSQFIGASSGEEGLALARQVRPHLITLDIMMPHMDGWSVLQKLKSDPELKQIPVFVVSIMDNKPLAFSLGIQDYLMKPFTREQLLSKLNLTRPDRILHALIVDDDESVRSQIAEVLLEEGYDIEAIDSGELAIRRLNQVQPDLLLLDLAMPQVSGFDVLAAIESLHFREMSTIVMTDGKLSSDQEAFLQRRVQAIVEKKSSTVADLAQRIRKTLPVARKAA